MRISRSGRAALAAMVVVAAAVGIAVASTAGGSVQGGDGECEPFKEREVPANLTGADYEASVSADRTQIVLDAPQRLATAEAFLKPFNSGKRKYEELPVGYSIFESGPVRSLDEVVSESEIVVIGVIERVTFSTSEFLEIPMSRVQLRAESVVKGDVGVRDTVEVLQIGGPLKRHWCEDADQFLVATDFLPVPKRGNRMVFFLIRDSGGALVLSGLRTSFTIANGHVVDDELSERAGIAGMSEDELVALLRLAESEP